jgi:hypothetical protein
MTGLSRICSPSCRPCDDHDRVVSVRLRSPSNPASERRPRSSDPPPKITLMMAESQIVAAKTPFRAFQAPTASPLKERGFETLEAERSPVLVDGWRSTTCGMCSAGAGTGVPLQLPASFQNNGITIIGVLNLWLGSPGLRESDRDPTKGLSADVFSDRVAGRPSAYAPA